MRDNYDSKPPPNPLIVVLEIVQAGHVESVAVCQYIKWRPNDSSIYLTSDQFFIIVKIIDIEGDVTDEITNVVDLFGLIMQQNVIENEFNREYAPLATIFSDSAI